MVHGGWRYGRWVEIWADGKRDEGERVNNKRQGPWTETLPDGTMRCGECKESVRVGCWVVTEPGGTTHEGEISGKTETVWTDFHKHGLWVTRRSDGTRLAQLWDKGAAIGPAMVRQQDFPTKEIDPCNPVCY